MNLNKLQLLTMYILQGWVRWYANCGFSHRSSVSFGQERTPKSAPTTCTNRYHTFGMIKGHPLQS